MKYIYYCPECGVSFELEFSMFEDRGEPRCITCDTVLVRKYTTPSVQFRGSGWSTGSSKEIPGGGYKELT